MNPAKTDDTKIIINIPSRTLELWKDDKINKIYPIGVGLPKTPTPIGSFKVISMIRNPGWENPYKPAGEIRIKPGKANPLGTRWLGFFRNRKGEFGIHGTNQPSSVGKFVSHGCIRMKIKNSEYTYSQVDFDTPVLIKYYPYKVKILNNKILVQKFPNEYKRKFSTIKIVNEQLKDTNKKYYLDKKKLSTLGKLKNTESTQIGYIVPENNLDISLTKTQKIIFAIYQVFKIKVMNLIFWGNMHNISKNH